VVPLHYARWATIPIGPRATGDPWKLALIKVDAWVLPPTVGMPNLRTKLTPQGFALGVETAIQKGIEVVMVRGPVCEEWDILLVFTSAFERLHVVPVAWATCSTLKVKTGHFAVWNKLFEELQLSLTRLLLLILEELGASNFARANPILWRVQDSCIKDHLLQRCQEFANTREIALGSSRQSFLSGPIQDFPAPGVGTQRNGALSPQLWKRPLPHSNFKHES